MFSRYINFTKDKFKEITFAVYDELVEFFQFNFPEIKVCSINTPYTYDYSVDIMELHYVLGIDFEHIPFASGYFKANEEKILEYKEKYFNHQKLKVGLFWQGNLKVFPYRSTTLEELSPLLTTENCQFYSCQKGAGIEQLEDFKDANIIDLGSTFDNYSDTAAALTNLDILITIDSSILHMAGALGVKTFLLLPHASEWRWFDDTQTTPWYDSVKLFKQERLYDWSVPVRNIIDELKSITK
jgi:ADP-heptose:LPS heptosyltransferase